MPEPRATAPMRLLGRLAALPMLAFAIALAFALGVWDRVDDVLRAVRARAGFGGERQ